MNLKVLIADDEPLGRRSLTSLLAEAADLEVVGECRQGLETVAAVRTLRPDLLFLDIQMPLLDGFGVLAELGPDAPDRVVFVSAHDQYAIRAFEVRALDYLLKPVSRMRFEETLARVRQPLPRSREALFGLVADMEARRPRMERFPVRQGSEITFLPTTQLEAIEATGNWMHLHTAQQSFMIRESMASLEARLDPDRFIRVHRSWILSLPHLLRVTFGSGGYAQASLTSGRHIPISRTHRPLLEARITQMERGTP